jgi:hypothetical protein
MSDLLPGEDPDTALNLWTKQEWFEVMRRIKPGLTQAEYDQQWDEFQARKAEHERQKGLQ